MKINRLFLWFSTSLLLIVASCNKTDISDPGKPDSDRISVLKAPDLDEHEWLAYILHDKTDFEMPTMRAEALVRNFANSGASTYSSGEEISVTTIRHLNPVTYSDTEHTGAYLVEFTSDGKEGYSICSSDMRFEQIFAFVPEGSVSDTVDNKALAGIIGNIDYIMRDSIERYNTLAEARYLSASQKIEAQMAEEKKEAEYKKRYSYYITDDVTGAQLDENDGWHPYSNPNNIFDFRRCNLNYSDDSQSETYQYSIPLKVKWHQEAPYNNEMPLAESGQMAGLNKRVVAGCTTIAVAQIMTYYRKGYSFSSNMWDAITFTPYLNLCDDAAIDAGAKMIKYVYNEVGSKPGPNGTGSDIDKARAFFNGNGFICEKPSGYNFDKVHLETGKNRLVYASSDSHAWVIYGTKKFLHKRIEYYDCEKYGGGGYYEKKNPYLRTNVYYYLQCNWGWGGNSDGWFSDRLLNPSSYNYTIDKVICGLS